MGPEFSSKLMHNHLHLFRIQCDGQQSGTVAQQSENSKKQSIMSPRLVAFFMLCWRTQCGISTSCKKHNKEQKKKKKRVAKCNKNTREITIHEPCAFHALNYDPAGREDILHAHAPQPIWRLINPEGLLVPTPSLVLSLGPFLFTCSFLMCLWVISSSL